MICFGVSPIKVCGHFAQENGNVSLHVVLFDFKKFFILKTAHVPLFSCKFGAAGC